MSLFLNPIGLINRETMSLGPISSLSKDPEIIYYTKLVTIRWPNFNTPVGPYLELKVLYPFHIL